MAAADPRAKTRDSDYVFVTFIVSELPHGAVGLLIAVLGGYGLFVLQSAGGFVVELYDRPLMAINFGRAASLDFAEMDKEMVRRASALEPERRSIDAKIEHLSRTFGEDLAVAAARSLYDDEKAVIEQIHELVARYPKTERATGFLIAKGLSPDD